MLHFICGQEYWKEKYLIEKDLEKMIRVQGDIKWPEGSPKLWFGFKVANNTSLIFSLRSSDISFELKLFKDQVLERFIINHIFNSYNLMLIKVC